MGAEVSFEVGTLGILLAAAGVFAAVDGRSFFPSRPPPALPLRAARWQQWFSNQWLLVWGQMARGLAADVLREKVGVVVEMRHVTIVSRVQVHSWRWDEPAVGKGHHG